MENIKEEIESKLNQVNREERDLRAWDIVRVLGPCLKKTKGGKFNTRYGIKTEEGLKNIILSIMFRE